MLAIVLVAAVAGGCGDDVSTAAPFDPADHEQELAFLEELSQLLDDDGALPLDTALGLFSTAVAPVEGATAMSLPNGEIVPIVVRRLLAAYDELSPDARSALDGFLGDRSATGPQAGPSRAPSDDELATRIASIVAELETRSGHDLGLTIRTHRVANNSAYLAQAYMRIDEAARVCHVDVTPDAFATGDAMATAVLAHEVWHCFQFDRHGPHLGARPLWMVEGQAEWVGEDHVGGTEHSAAWWYAWIGSPERSLFRRSYDAIGLYAVAAQDGVGPHRRMLDMLDRSNLAAVEQLFATPADDIAVNIGRRLVRSASFGPDWQSDGPGIIDARRVGQFELEVGVVHGVSLDVGAVAALPVEITVPEGEIAWLRIVSGTGAVQLPGAPRVALAQGEDGWWCLRPEGCTCPDGSTPGGGEPMPASPGVGAVGLGRSTVGPLEVIGRLLTLEDACTPSIRGTWVTPYDPLLDLAAAPFGAPPIDCAGQVVWTFDLDLTYTTRSTAECAAGPVTALVATGSRGTYTAIDGTISLTATGRSGTMTIGGTSTELDLDAGVGLTTSAEYVVDDTTLRITFVAGGDGGVRSVSFTRAD